MTILSFSPSRSYIPFKIYWIVSYVAMRLAAVLSSHINMLRLHMQTYIFHGVDTEGNPVYTIGRKSSKLVVPAFKNLSLLLQDKYQIHEKIVFSNTSPTVPFAMTMGGFLSRELKIDFIGVPLLVVGAKQCCHNILELVEHTKQIGKSTNLKVIVLENKRFK